MSPTINWNCPHQELTQNLPLKYSLENEKKILKAILLWCLHKLFSDLFKQKIQVIKNQFLMECYVMDSKILQLILQGIIETGEYTLEGVACYTRIPLDVIYDAACGLNNQVSITPWARVVDLYIKVKPDTAQILIDKLIELKNKNSAALSCLLTER